MINQERAEKIVKDIETYPLIELSDAERVEAVAYFASQLDEAVEVGRTEIRQACSQHQHEQYADGFKSGFAAAREQAAGIANKFECNSRWIPEGIAERIRTMSPTGPSTPGGNR